MFLSPNFSIVSYPADNASWETAKEEWSFPYRNQSDYTEQKEKALRKYDELSKSLSPERIVMLDRLSCADLEEGDCSPTLLRRSDDPTYSYDGFSEIWER